MPCGLSRIPTAVASLWSRMLFSFINVTATPEIYTCLPENPAGILTVSFSKSQLPDCIASDRARRSSARLTYITVSTDTARGLLRWIKQAGLTMYYSVVPLPIATADRRRYVIYLANPNHGSSAFNATSGLVKPTTKGERGQALVI